MTAGHLWVFGDSWTDPRGYAWAPMSGWPQVLAARLAVGLVNSGVSGAGYVHAGAVTFPALAAQGWGAGAACVVVHGGVNDATTDQPGKAVYESAVTTYGLIRRLCPDAALIVAGPQWGAHPWTPGLVAVRDAVRDAAADMGADFIDTAGWFLRRPDLMLDMYHPTTAGHALIADRLEGDVGRALLAGSTLRA